MASLGELTQVVSPDAHRLKRDLQGGVADVKGLLSRQIPLARQMLRKLLARRLEFSPLEENGRRGYRFTGQGTHTRPYWPERRCH